MVKLITQLIGSEVILFQERLRAGIVKNVIIDYTDGSFFGVIMKPYTERKEKVVKTEDIKTFGQGIIIVEEADSMSDAEDLVRLQELLPQNPEIIGAIAETESGEKIGKVSDATINFELSMLDKIYISPHRSIAFLAKEIILPAKKIAKIEKKKIIFKDDGGKQKAKKKVAVPALNPITE